jgi:hypothetical protein
MGIAKFSPYTGAMDESGNKRETIGLQKGTQEECPNRSKDVFSGLSPLNHA